MTSPVPSAFLGQTDRVEESLQELERVGGAVCPLESALSFIDGHVSEGSFLPGREVIAEVVQTMFSLSSHKQQHCLQS